MNIDELLDERDRLLMQRADILRAMADPVGRSDLDQEAQEDFRIGVEQALDDAFFGLIDPLEAGIAEHEASTEWRRQRADIIDIRARQ